MPQAAEARYGVTLPLSNGADVNDVPADIIRVLTPLLQKGARFDVVASTLPTSGFISGRFVWVTSTSKLYYDNGTGLTQINFATGLGGSPPADVVLGGIPDEGTSTSASRLGHAHSAPLGQPASSNPGDATSQGATGKFADAGHVHGREAAVGSVSSVMGIGINRSRGVNLITGSFALAGWVRDRLWRVEARLNIGDTLNDGYAWILTGSALPPPFLAQFTGGGAGSLAWVTIPGCIRFDAGTPNTLYDLTFKPEYSSWYISQGGSPLVGATVSDRMSISADYLV